MSARRDRTRIVPGSALGVLGVLVSAFTIAAGAAGQTAAPVEDIRDIRAPRVEAADWLLPIAIGAALAAGLLGYGIWRRRRRRRRRSLAPPSPLERAERRLEAVRAWMTPAGAPRFAVEVSALVREYIEQRFGVGATLLTSEEFLRRMLASSDPTLVHQRARLLEFLRQSDVAKFAGEPPTVAAMQALHAEASLFVRETAGREEADDALPAT